MFKFLALIAVASAAKLASKEGPSCHDVAMRIREQCDQDHNDQISWREAQDCGAPREWRSEFQRVAGSDGLVNYDEFMAECQAHAN